MGAYVKTRERARLSGGRRCARAKVAANPCAVKLDVSKYCKIQSTTARKRALSLYIVSE
jgi:hypothetical protein